MDTNNGVNESAFSRLAVGVGLIFVIFVVSVKSISHFVEHFLSSRFHLLFPSLNRSVLFGRISNEWKERLRNVNENGVGKKLCSPQIIFKAHLL